MPHRVASDMMVQSVVTLSPVTDIYSAMQTLLRYSISGAPVVDDAGRLVGMLSEKDCLRVLAGEAFDGLPEGRVGDYMTREVESVSPDTSLLAIVRLFLDRTYRCLPVVDQVGLVVGQISRREVVAAIESIHDNSYLYGPADAEAPADGKGVDSAMRLARGQR